MLCLHRYMLRGLRGNAVPNTEQVVKGTIIAASGAGGLVIGGPVVAAAAAATAAGAIRAADKIRDGRSGEESDQR